MSDAVYIELPPTPKKRRSFLRGWVGAVLCLFILAVILAGCFSWWLSQGKISSSYARVDTVVFTVEPGQMARVEAVLVRQGEEVRSGQPLAMIEPANPKPAQPPMQASDYPGSGEISGRLTATQETERRMVTRLTQARMEEEKYQKLYHDRVTEHVSSQLALRATDRANYAAYDQAAKFENQARNRVELAREEFEKVSKMRAATEIELDRIRMEIYRRKMRSSRSAPKPEPLPVQPEAPQKDAIYAPVAGKIMGIDARPGQQVYQGQPIFMILPEGNRDSWIQAWFPLSAQHSLKLGQKANIKAGQLHVTGRVSAISQEGQYLPSDGSGRNYTQLLPVRIQVEDPKELAKLVPGTNVECQIQTRYVIGETMF